VIFKTLKACKLVLTLSAPLQWTVVGVWTPTAPATAHTLMLAFVYEEKNTLLTDIGEIKRLFWVQNGTEMCAVKKEIYIFTAFFIFPLENTLFAPLVCKDTYAVIRKHSL
jgi:hypothetical protein